MLLQIALVVFATVFCATIAGYYIVQMRMSARARATKRRLEDLSTTAADESPAVSILLQEEKLSSIPLMHRLMEKFSVSRQIQTLIVQAGAETTPGTVVLSMAFLAVVTLISARYLTHSLIVGLLLAPLAASAPYAYLKYRRSKRVAQFEESLPEALDMIVNALRSGFTFELAIKMVAQEIDDPLGYEFAVVFEEQNLGVPLQDALAGLRYRVPSDDLDLLIVSLVLHRRTGGNLAEVLDKTAGTIRDRFRLKREIRTKTAHGRFSGFVLVVLPLVMIGILMVTAPHYLVILINDKAGQYLLITAVVMQLVGIFVIKKIINIKI